MHPAPTKAEVTAINAFISIKILMANSDQVLTAVRKHFAERNVKKERMTRKKAFPQYGQDLKDICN